MEKLTSCFRSVFLSPSIGVAELARFFGIHRPISVRSLIAQISLYFDLSLERTCRVIRFPADAGVRSLAKRYKTTGDISLRKLMRTVWDHSSLNKIEHIFVLVMENRSFDHMLGFSKIHGVDSRTGIERDIDGIDEHAFNVDSHGKVHHASSPGWFRFPVDPNHQLPQVMNQICGSTRSCEHPTNQGFVRDFELLGDPGEGFERNKMAPGEIMRCMDRTQVPVLAALADEFAVCDSWFSSMPGPTWPNRFFVHAATAGGYDHDPSGCEKAWKMVFSDSGFEFEHGSIFLRLDEKDIPWVVYSDASWPPVWSIPGVHEGDIDDMEWYPVFISNPEFEYRYVFIEPDNDIDMFGDGGEDANSQHPPAHLWLGERFIKDIYEQLRASPIWEKSALIITYDEHGGFFDHVPPPRAEPPGDTPIEFTEFGFKFDRLGVRVPAIVISPWIPKSTVVGGQRPRDDIYDHTSILATLERRFDVRSLTMRDAMAPDLEHMFRLVEPRKDAPLKLPAIPEDFDEDASLPPPPPPPRPHAASAYRTRPTSQLHALPPRLANQLYAAIKRELKRTPDAHRDEVRARLQGTKTIGELLDALRALRDRPRRRRPTTAAERRAARKARGHTGRGGAPR